MPMLDLLAAYWDYTEAKGRMIEAGRNRWPDDPLCDAVQAQGMRFCQQWRAHADEIAVLVILDSERFPEFRGAQPVGDPRDYIHHHLIMPRLME